MSGSNPGFVFGQVPTPAQWNTVLTGYNVLHFPFNPMASPYNAVFDGVTDDTAAWQAMFADIATRGFGEVVVPAGVSKVRGGVLNIPNQCKIRGQGMASSVIQRLNSGSTGLLLDMSGTATNAWKQNCVLEDFTIDGLGAFNGGMLRIVYGNGHYVNRCQFTNTNDFALQLVQVWDSVFDNNRIIQCGENTSATAFTSGDEGGGSTIGSECIQILGAIASSGFGSSADSSNQLRFRDNLIETFSAGAICQCNSVGTSSGTSSHSILFSGTKIETNVFTGKYLIQQSGDVKTSRYEYTYCGYQGSSGANVGTQQVFYFVNGEGAAIEYMTVNVAVNGLQSFIKTFSNGGGEINNIKAQTAGTLTKGVIWAAGGTNPNVLGVIIPGAPSSLATIYNDSYTLFHSGA